MSSTVFPAFGSAGSARTHGGHKAILIVEDDPIFTVVLEHALQRAGYRVVGPAGTMSAALALVREARIDAALLDVNLGAGETSYPVAHLLAARHIPFAFVTGCEHAMPPEFQMCHVLRKPVSPATIHTVCASLWSPPGKGEGSPADSAL